MDLDRVPTVDPHNPEVSEANSMVWSLAVVPGPSFVDGRNDMPHGAVSTVYYYSGRLGRQRRMHIYTHPD